MRFEELIAKVGDEPLFDAGLLLAGDIDPEGVHRQLSRWVQAGKLLQLGHDLYVLAAPFRKAYYPHPFLVANRLIPGSYVSLQSALSHSALIPEGVPVTTSVMVGSPSWWDTPLGSYQFRHLHSEFFLGFRKTLLVGGQEALVATPEKALLDLVYLEPDGDSLEYLTELRLQNLDGLDCGEVRRLAEVSGTPKLRRATEWIAHLAEVEAREYRLLLQK